MRTQSNVSQERERCGYYVTDNLQLTLLFKFFILSEIKFICAEQEDGVSHLFWILCWSFSDRDFVSLVKPTEGADVRLVRVLLQLGNGGCWQSFTDKICASFINEDSNCILGVQDLRLDVFSWELPIAHNAQVPGHPDVEAFLRSTLPYCTYPYHFHVEDNKFATKFLQNQGPIMDRFRVDVKPFVVFNSTVLD